MFIYQEHSRKKSGEAAGGLDNKGKTECTPEAVAFPRAVIGFDLFFADRARTAPLVVELYFSKYVRLLVLPFFLVPFVFFNFSVFPVLNLAQSSASQLKYRAVFFFIFLLLLALYRLCKMRQPGVPEIDRRSEGASQE